MSPVVLPEKLEVAVEAVIRMLQHRQTGSVQVNIKDGVLVNWDEHLKHPA